jgi:hypothetical protein
LSYCIIYRGNSMYHNLINLGKLLLLFCVSLILVSGCSYATSDEYDENRVNTILYNIKQAFNNHDIDGLMIYFHHDYLHNGQSKLQIEQVWLDRMAQYLLIDFQNIDIDVHGDAALVTFTMVLQTQHETVNYDEPDSHGDLSFFEYIDSDWYVYGNQHYK